ncbi:MULTISPECIES: type I restriction-modification system subunit M N-terminal domain-containing protein [unclassified Streptosporangium]|uniref:type I restriction-modification system subunit M N-terminal domain-containing protein n=1 Tax=unclassified Streptosporangium TaxID=2632669 RepID=UPI002E2C47CA|nr:MULTISPECIES: type I restriction-modification system subunit M N-terminal domain-containing protein [unclassified Streptosporangium]
MSGNHQKYADFIWSVADPLRGDYRRSEYGKAILPFTVPRRIDCVLEPTKKDVLAEAERLKGELLPLRKQAQPASPPMARPAVETRPTCRRG